MCCVVVGRDQFPVEEVLKRGHVPPKQGVYVERVELITRIRKALHQLTDHQEGYVCMHVCACVYVMCHVCMYIRMCVCVLYIMYVCCIYASTLLSCTCMSSRHQTG